MPDLMSLPSAEARIILALRLAIASHKQRIDARKDIAARLGGKAPMGRFLILIETIGHAWPDSFGVGRCCCPSTTADEILLICMIRYVANEDRPKFDTLLCEMIDDCGRERIYNDIGNFIRSYAV
ncbi:hypothetical protein [Parasphingorhabdus halotolerans]|uniref:Addiction module antidote protein n=1 Tax=Parasphingorhabdus halotolerans TaxID=2725558 RepID=A0A6H2DMF8_9SPHN|nr:hypothetical protein [Parasphingorhabdus halotolerans]QJB69173.1 hypothetical protein HF685_07695 [Parasphingorhabdus halotolerans]